MKEIKFLWVDTFHHTYITKKGTHILDINMNPKNPDFYKSSRNDDMGKPEYSLKNDQFKIVEEFSENE